jgi:hypothetical protein
VEAKNSEAIPKDQGAVIGPRHQHNNLACNNWHNINPPAITLMPLVSLLPEQISEAHKILNLIHLPPSYEP